MVLDLNKPGKGFKMHVGKVGKVGKVAPNCEVNMQNLN